VVGVRCGHTFHRDCMKKMFRNAMVDESLYPPKCCKEPIELAEVQQHFAPSLVEALSRRARELSTPNRVYCSNRRCSTFLSAVTTSPTPLYCPECHSSTCASCKQPAHMGKRMCTPSSSDDYAVLEFGRSKNWQRCPSCQHLIELEVGCYHVLCRCGTQFCYLCGVKWKNCSCTLFYVPPEDPQEGEPPI
ncbi:hypothetical protein BC628DRAFT_1275651, partial [Trametes gibbosa]